MRVERFRKWAFDELRRDKVGMRMWEKAEVGKSRK
ncbi:hypothetical protein D1AOALGA4SA_8470 [Olavius algarvensis Delta 1 endosymbiont]|nr:hypothetical protein D1AOALGA4SA_8470 [Olavius algarvensis Delta 1 endosymbiont]